MSNVVEGIVNKELQEKILEIAEYFDQFCAKYKITYYLMGGTALGAMRHGGFIPWDDDFDVFMDHENYWKLLSLVDEKLDSEQYYFQRENTTEWPLYFSKLRLNGTTYIEEDVYGREMHHGIYIDIMCLNNAYNNDSARYIQYLAARILNAAALGQRGYLTQSARKVIAMKLGRILVRGWIKWALLLLVRRPNQYASAELVGHFFGRAPYRKTSFPKSYLGTPRRVKFENLYLPVPERVEEYLSLRYGPKYMDIPSKNERDKYPSHAYRVDIHQDYRKHLDDLHSENR